MTADVDDTFEFRWDALIPRSAWTNDYYSPVGTQPDTTNGNRGCTEAWVFNPGTVATYADDFNATPYAFTNSTGTTNWAPNPWTESEANGPAAGDIQVTGGQLRIGDVTATGVNVLRQIPLLPGDRAILSLDYIPPPADATDTDSVQLQVRPNGAAGWTTLATFSDGGASGSSSFDLGAAVSPFSATTQIRFNVSAALEAGDYFYFDNVRIRYTTGALTVNIDLPGGANPDATLTVNPGIAREWPTASTNLYNQGFHMYTTGSPAPAFLPIQIVDCTKDTSGTDGRLFDWGNPALPGERPHYTGAGALRGRLFRRELPGRLSRRGFSIALRHA